MSHGWTQAQIAREFDKPQSWVSDIVRGRYLDLKWSDGESLLKLHKKVMGKSARQNVGAAHA